MIYKAITKRVEVEVTDPITADNAESIVKWIRANGGEAVVFTESPFDNVSAGIAVDSPTYGTIYAYHSCRILKDMHGEFSALQDHKFMDRYDII